METKVTFKMALGEELVRWTVSREVNFAQIERKARETFELKEPKFKYRDEDGDLISISCQDDLEECIAQNLNPVRLFLREGASLSTNSNSAQEQAATHKQKCTTMPTKDEEVPEIAAAVHHGVSCDGCNMYPIVGPRYKSLTKPDFDVCSKCEASNDTKLNDLYIRIDTPKERGLWSLASSLKKQDEAHTFDKGDSVDSVDSVDKLCKAECKGDVKMRLKKEDKKQIKKLFKILYSTGNNFDVNANIPADKIGRFWKVVLEFAPRVREVLVGQKSAQCFFGDFLSMLSTQMGPDCAGAVEGCAASEAAAAPEEGAQEAPAPAAARAVAADPVSLCGAAAATQDPVTSSTQPVHVFVTCDACGASPIVGPRYKSMSKENFDLCGECHGRGDPALADTYMRINVPTRTLTSTPTPWPCGAKAPAAMGTGMRRALPAVQPMARRELASMPALREARFSTALPGTPLPFRPRCVPKPKAFSDMWLKPSAPKLDARFVRDVTVSDGTEIPCGHKFLKVWEMRNTGSLAWPEETCLMHIGGDVLASRSVDRVIPQGGLAVGGQLDISVQMTAPEHPGRYVTYYRLMSPDGLKFGQRIWALIQVVAEGMRKECATITDVDIDINPAGVAPADLPALPDLPVLPEVPCPPPPRKTAVDRAIEEILSKELPCEAAPLDQDTIELLQEDPAADLAPAPAKAATPPPMLLGSALWGEPLLRLEAPPAPEPKVAPEPGCPPAALPPPLQLPLPEAPFVPLPAEFAPAPVSAERSQRLQRLMMAFPEEETFLELLDDPEAATENAGGAEECYFDSTDLTASQLSVPEEIMTSSTMTASWTSQGPLADEEPIEAYLSPTAQRQVAPSGGLQGLAGAEVDGLEDDLGIDGPEGYDDEEDTFDTPKTTPAASFHQDYAPELEPEPEPEPEAAWERELSLLAEIGFTETEKNIFLLAQHDGKIPAVVNELIALSSAENDDDEWENVTDVSSVCSM